MATLEDKIFGNKLHNYCSSSEDEDDEPSKSDNESGKSDNEGKKNSKVMGTKEQFPPVNNWSGTASNTGPKGVLEDWRRFKQMEAENREEMAKERIALAKKLTLSVRTEAEDTKAKELEEFEDELKELMDEEFLLKYQKQRMQELMAQLQKVPKFGKVVTLNTQDEYLNAVDKEHSTVTVIIHIFNKRSTECQIMDGCLKILATDYPNIKFCRLNVDIAGLSHHFRVEGVPALLVYKDGQIIGNFVQLATELGSDFFAVDVERLLIEFGILPEK